MAQQTKVFIGVGSNIGNRVGMITQALDFLNCDTGRVVKTSMIYETDPCYVKEQPRFLNLVLEYETSLPPLELLQFTQNIEQKLHRNKNGQSKGPRTLDLDILNYGSKSVDLPELQIPHPDMANRDFVQIPLADLQPQLNSGQTEFKVQSNPTKVIPTHKRVLRLGKTPLIMGIVNLTPDSFTPYGRLGGHSSKHVVEYCEKLLSEGADILDIGGESTRPGSVPIPPEEQLERVGEVIEAIRAALPEAILSLDTTEPSLVAHISPDILNYTGFEPLTFNFKIPTVIMHSRSHKTRNEAAYNGETVKTVTKELKEKIEASCQYDFNIITDPGIGFGKTAAQSWDLLCNSHSTRLHPYSQLLGYSYKSFLYQLSNNLKDRHAANLAVASQVFDNVEILRVHDVKETRIMLEVISKFKNG